jgi:hypothetical protein
MTHLTKPKVPVVNDFTEFKQLFTQEERENTPYTFSNGHLVYIDTTNPDMMAFAESKGLTPD